MKSKTETKSEKKMRPVRIALLTPYLIDSVESMAAEMQFHGKSFEDFLAQFMQFGYNPDNLAGLTSLMTNNHAVLFSTPGYTPGRGFLPLEKSPEADLMIAGCTTGFERDVSSLKNSGLLVGRYSIFYGHPSNYTGRTPESAGYAFDIPKHVEAVKSLITDDATLEALALRNENKIRRAIGKLNERFPQPVLITTFLSEALAITPAWKNSSRSSK